MLTAPREERVWADIWSTLVEEGSSVMWPLRWFSCSAPELIKQASRVVGFLCVLSAGKDMGLCDCKVYFIFVFLFIKEYQGPPYCSELIKVSQVVSRARVEFPRPPDQESDFRMYWPLQGTNSLWNALRVGDGVQLFSFATPFCSSHAFFRPKCRDSERPRMGIR